MKPGLVMVVLIAAAVSFGAPPSGRFSPVCAQDSSAPRFEGSASCKKCHFKEYKSWEGTKMAKAFETLRPGAAAEEKKKFNLDPAKDYTLEAKCVSCHTTGYGQPGGYPALVEGVAWTKDETERSVLMQGVGCESCHGPGEKASAFKKDNKEYAWKDLVARGAVHPAENGCVTCHSKESPSFEKFDFSEARHLDLHEIVPLKNDHGCDHPHGAKK